MLLTIIKKEWADLLQDSRLRWTVIILYLLFAVALFTGTRYYVTASAESEAAQKASYEQWLRQGKKNPHGAAHYGFYAYKPLSPMAIIDRGMESYLGQAVWLEAHNQNEVKEREATDAGSIVRFGYLSIGFIFQALFPLAIILLGFNLFSKEKEWGTLPLLLSSETSAGTLLKGKAIALYRLVVVLALPLLLTCCVSMLIAAGYDAWVAALPRFITLAFFLLLYFLLWVLLSLYTSTLVRTSSVSLVALLALWIFGSFFVPRTSGVLAKLAYPSPSAFAFSLSVQQDNELGIDRKTPARQRQKQFEDSLLTTYGAATLAALPLNIRGLSLQHGEEYGYRIFEKNYGGLEKIYGRQNRLIDWLNLLSPSQSLRNISAGMCGTGISKHHHFAAQAEAHRRLIARTMNEDIAENSGSTENYQNDENLWEQIPPFQYREASLAEAVKPHAIPMLSLALWCGMLLTCLARRAGTIRTL